MTQRFSDVKSLNALDDKGGIHMYSPRVENSINTYFTAGQKDDMNKRVVQELLAEEQAKAISYLNSTPRRRIQELGRIKGTPLLFNEQEINRSPHNKTLKRNVIHP